MTGWLVLDGGWADPAAAEHAVHEVLASLGVHGATTMACTHLVGPGTSSAHVAASVEFPDGLPRPGVPALPAGTAVLVAAGPGATPDGAGPPELLDAAREMLQRRQSRTDGRAFHYAGRESLSGGMTVGEITAGSAITAVVDLVGRPLPTTDVVQTFGYARPTFAAGELVLMVSPYADEQHVPFELESPHQCCSFH